jgi:hypothetical protein
MKIQAAKKEHKCDDCGGKILPGTRYWRDYQEDDDGDTIRDRKTHTNCLIYDSEGKSKSPYSVE